jgi:predicted nucleic acid-binding protein
VDTSVWVDYLRGKESLKVFWLDQQLTRGRIGLTDLILCELLQGYASAEEFAEVKQEMMAYRLFATGGEALAVAAANNYRLLRTRGITVRKTIDCLIATFCLAEGHVLLHNDRDFDPFEEFLGLLVVHPQPH